MKYLHGAVEDTIKEAYCSGHEIMLLAHFGNGLVVTDVLKSDGIQVTAEELLPGEKSAVVYKVGQYTVCVARDYDYPSGDALADLVSPKEDIIYARHNSNPNGEFKEICRVVENAGACRFEHISCICTAKTKRSAPDDSARLFVHHHYIGSSFQVDTWYALDTDGNVESYGIHPYAEG